MSGGSDQRLDLDVIKEMGTGLNNVTKAFEGLEKLTGRYRDDFGHGDLADKFEDFASNWELSREKLMDEVKTLAKIAKESAKAYEAIDHQLADAIRGAQDDDAPKRGK
ncbi:hypothetical protein [Streptomyces shenzhenensis]|uniref:hypothetical protein n=1 Tax=Streptomyces shenzhenensis TaxID=943815 RepID=UPI0015F0342D|nr:hypothetical protein [Streptomyces shenzhenensis]